MHVSEDEEGMARHGEQPETAFVDYEEHCESHSLDGRSDQFEEHAQLKVKKQAAKCSSETPSIPAPWPWRQRQTG